MKGKIGKVVLSTLVLALLFGCAANLRELRGKEKLEAKDWVNAGNLAFNNRDYDTAQYFYELTIKKYPDTHYGKKARENLGYVNYRKSTFGKVVQQGVDSLDPIF